LDLYREPPGDYSGQLRIVKAEFYEKPVSLDSHETDEPDIIPGK